MKTAVERTLERMIDIPEEKVKNFANYEIFFMNRRTSPIEGKLTGTLIPIRNSIEDVKFDWKEREMIDELDRQMNLNGLDDERIIKIYAYLLSKQIRHFVINGQQEEES